MKIIKKNKGLTLIELIVVLGLIGIIMTPVYSILINNLKTFDRQNVELELQYQSQNAMYYLIDKNMQASGLKQLNDVKISADTCSWKDEVEVTIERNKKFAFEIGNISEDIEPEDNIFELKSTTDKLFNNFNGSTSPTTEVGNYIKQIKLSAINGTLGNTDGIEVEVKVEKDGQYKIVNNKLYFRNNSNN